MCRSLCRTLLSVAYGLPAEYVDGRYVDLLREADNTLTQALDPAVMFIPFLRYLPSWFPGGGWKSGIERWRAVAVLTRDLPYQDTLQAMVRFISALPSSCLKCVLLSKTGRRNHRS